MGSLSHEERAIRCYVEDLEYDKFFDGFLFVRNTIYHQSEEKGILRRMEEDQILMPLEVQF